MTILETERLVLREMILDDAPFILELLNDADWRRFIGDRGVRTLVDARTYIQDGPLAMYARVGFGLWLIVRKADRQPLGMCGLLTRAGLSDVDIGFALMPAFRAQGYAREAAAACLQYGLGPLKLKRIVAITTHDNHTSAKLLEGLGMRFEKNVRIPGDPAELRLFSSGA